MEIKNIKSKRFGKLVALEFKYRKRYLKGGNTYWLCRCDCGNKKIIHLAALQSGNTISCGCRNKETQFKSNHKHSITTRQKLSIISKGRVISKKTRQKISEANKGKEISLSQRLFLSESRKGKNNPMYDKTPWNKGKPNIYSTGDKNWNWKGGITPLQFKIRASILYKKWRDEVFKRDNYTCQFCGIKSQKNQSVYLNVDHIKPFSIILHENKISSLEKAMDCLDLWLVANGRTLCVGCHKKTETYGYKLNRNKYVNR